MESVLDYAKDFFCGCVSGWAQILVMQPFQIIKVRLINQSLLRPEYSGIFDCFRKISRQQGYLAFYKGSLSPMIGVGAQVSLQFGTNQIVKKILAKFGDAMFDLNKEVPEEPTEKEEKEDFIPMSMIFFAGLLTGLPSSLAVTPIDHTRIVVQLQKGNHSEYNGSIDAGRQILKKYGLRGLYLGFHITLIREILAMAVYFTNYEYVMRLYAPEGQSSAKAPIAVAFFAGGLSGSSSWFFTYPIDYVKTLIQSQNLSQRKYTSSMNCAITKYKEEGVRTFFKGLGVTMMRSFPVNGIGFFSFEYMMRALGRKKQ